MPFPKVSIIIVTYNVAGCIQKCLDSIYAQEYQALEIVVVDGASNDGTVELLKKNEKFLDHWVSEPDRGIYDAMNKALARISGEWVYFIGADDTLLPDFSKFLLKLTQRNTIYYGSVNVKGNRYLGFLSPYKQAKTGICHQSMVYPRAVFKRYHFDTKYKISADHVLNMKCANDPDFNFQFEDFIIANFNHTGVSSTSKDALFEKEKARLIFENFGFNIWLRFTFRRFKARMFNREI